MILVTGGTGYIGPQLVHELRKDPVFQNRDIVIFDSLRGRFDYFGEPAKGFKVFRNLDERFSGLDLVVGDVRHNTEKINSLVEEAEYVFHLGAVTGAGYSNDNRNLYWETIFDGTMNMFEAAKKTELESFINISSCNIYGRSPEKELGEKSSINPANTYAKAKASAEKVISERGSRHKVPVTSLRLATNFGNQEPEYGGTRYNLVVNKFVKQAIEGKPLTPYGNGKNWRPYIHVKDSARMIKEAAKAETGHGEVFNAGFTDMNYRVEEIASKVREKVEKKMEKDVKIDYKREKDPGPSYRVDFSKINKKFDLRREFDLDRGILNLVNNYERGDEEVVEKWDV